ncbi:extracellular solute-binding protein [Pinisolibacter sp.]|uniref:extracellular solute-binding protein n=1 Tax=Pinisolibacter sp. TaxID=2172024 RepID=UPI002FDC975F
MSRSRLLAPLALCATVLAMPAAAEEVNVYTTREPGLFAPLAAAFTAETGIKVNTVFVKDGLAERVATEGAASPADVLMTVDVGNLVELVNKGVTKPMKSAAVEAAVPANLRSPDGAWTALSLRARLVWVDKAAAPAAITYEELADPKWKGKICIRSGQHPYNTALIAAMIARAGEAKTEAWLAGLKANLAKKPGGGDRDVARDILGGLCTLGVGNSYYVGLMRSGAGGPDQKTWGDGVAVVLPTFADGGTHVNATGAALAKNAPNEAAARKLIEYLVSPAGQKIYAEQNFEYPVDASASVTATIAALGTLKPDTVPLAEIARHRKATSLLVDKVRFDQ